jgi:ATP-dependent DNA helicase
MYARQVGGDMVKDMAERSGSTSAPPPSDPSSTNTRTGRSGLGASKQITTPPKKKKSISTVPKSKKSKVDLDEVVHQGEMKAEQPIISANQPKLVTGAVMKDYQLVGTSWLISLFKNGLNGILADEMVRHSSLYDDRVRIDETKR